MRSTGSNRAKQIISWSPSGTGTTNGRVTFLRKVLEAINSPKSAEEILEGAGKSSKAPVCSWGA